MTDNEIMQFVGKVVKAIQSNYTTHNETKEALTDVLEDADTIAEKLTGKRIVNRGYRSVIDALISQPLSKIAAIKKATE